MTVAELVDRLREFPDWYAVQVGRQPARFETHCASCDDDECEGVGDDVETVDDVAELRRGVGPGTMIL